MGIRVVCPNGHKLNVKSFLAGKRGVCPHCNAKFDIPAKAAGATEKVGATEAGAAEENAEEKMQSVGSVSQGATAATAASTSSAELRASHLAKGAAAARGAPSVVAAAPATHVVPAAALPAAVMPAAGSGQTATPLAAPVVGVQAVVQPAAPISAAVVVPAVPSVASPLAVADPLSEAPEACWYVRPPTGGQYGPAKPNTMRQWIAEGRVTGDSLVWREGWPDWKLANATFPALAGAGAAVPAVGGVPAVLVAATHAAVTPAADDPFAGIGPSNASAAGVRKPGGARRSDGTGRVVAIAALCMALVVLAAILVYVLKIR